MESIYDYLNSDFKSSLEDWESNLKTELKAETLEGLISKTTVDGSLPVLSLKAQGHYLEVREHWKKSSQTYLKITSESAQEIQSDLENGVRFFVFDTDLSQKDWDQLESVFQRFEKIDEVEVLVLGDILLKTSGLKVSFEKNLISGKHAHDLGGNQAQELALACLNFIEKNDPSTDVMVFLDSEIFSNIAKIRALRLLLMKVTESWGVTAGFRLIALSSHRDWTLFERYSNILKNVASVSAGYMGGADLVQSSGFLSLHERLKLPHDGSETPRSKILARNTSHILALESMLGVVEDPAFGSFHLETLTHSFAEEAWTLMQKLLPLSSVERTKEIESLTRVSREGREKEMRKRKHVMAGINDFPDRETLGAKTLPDEKTYRRARSFEELRVRVENLKHRPSVFIAVFGNYASLNARVNFAKNYFQLLGLEVHEGEVSATSQAEILTLVAADEDYEKLNDRKFPHEMKFLAGKTHLEGFKNIHAGQDTLSVLEEIVKHWEAK